ncbi:uncharacterized protein LOC116263628 [Nymphaea colorata]|uniref:uncharacterized protein LOC116263628 n=1 Tax=Nymphaea colorata TaxID=210225 RepID=UPI00129DC8AC|nr:uncharacterized protein LOC116263628 [Nymphaea colorata]
MAQEPEQKPGPVGLVKHRGGPSPHAPVSWNAANSALQEDWIRHRYLKAAVGAGGLAVIFILIQTRSGEEDWEMLYVRESFNAWVPTAGRQRRWPWLRENPIASSDRSSPYTVTLYGGPC